jgi:hypothetical protein
MNVVQVLEKALAMAKDEDVVSVGLFLVMPDRDVHVLSSDFDEGKHLMIAGSALLHHDIMHGKAQTATL